MSADQELVTRVTTDDKTTHSVVRFWTSKCQEQPSVRLTKENLIGALKDDKSAADAVESLEEHMHDGEIVWVTGASSVIQDVGSYVEIKIRFS